MLLCCRPKRLFSDAQLADWYLTQSRCWVLLKFVFSPSQSPASRPANVSQRWDPWQVNTPWQQQRVEQNSAKWRRLGRNSMPAQYRPFCYRCPICVGRTAATGFEATYINSHFHVPHVSYVTQEKNCHWLSHSSSSLPTASDKVWGREIGKWSRFLCIIKRELVWNVETKQMHALGHSVFFVTASVLVYNLFSFICCWLTLWPWKRTFK